MENDLQIALIVFADQDAGAAPAGWTRITGAPLEISTGRQADLLQRTVPSPVPTDETFAAAVATDIAGAVISVRAVDLDAPVHIYATHENISGNSHEALSVRPTLDNILLVSLYSFWFANTEANVASSQTERADVSTTGASLVIGTEDLGGESKEVFTGSRIATTPNEAGVSMGVQVLVAPEPQPVDARDLYKSQTLRKILPRSYDRRRASNIAKVLAAIGERDNFIGGLFGDRNFLSE